MTDLGMEIFKLAQPKIVTDRLVLRALEMSDCSGVAKLANHPAIEATTAALPYPYYESDARTWISSHRELWRNRQSVTYGIFRRQAVEKFIGTVSLSFFPNGHSAELGYWIGVDFWNQGYATEASKVVIDFGFRNLTLNKIKARHLVGNPASGRVLEKCGMEREGLLRQDFRKKGIYYDMSLFGITYDRWAASTSGAGKSP